MQRSFTYNQFIDYFVLFMVYVAYESLSSIYLFLPPLLSIILWYMIKYIRSDNLVGMIFISLLVIIYEVDKGYILFSVLIYFVIVIYFILPKLEQFIICKSCIRFVIVLLAYVGLYVFSLIFAQAFWLDVPAISATVLYYILVEFFIVSLL